MRRVARGPLLPPLRGRSRRTLEVESDEVHPELADFIRSLRLRPAREAPAALVELVLSSRGGPFSAAGRPGRTQPGWRRRLSWTAAALPAGAVAVVLPLSLAHSPAMDPSHVPTPCTLHLVMGHGQVVAGPGRPVAGHSHGTG